MEVMSVIKGMWSVYRTGDFLYKKMCNKRGFSFIVKYEWNYLKARKKQKELIELARANKLKATSVYEKDKIERLKNRNFEFLFYRDQYTILQNDCLINTKEIEIKVLESGKDVVLVNVFKPEFYKFPEDFDFEESKSRFRFTDFTIKCKIYDKDDKLIQFKEYYSIKNNTFCYKIVIEKAKKDEIFKIFYSVSVPDEFKSKVIKTKYNTPIPYLEIVIQRDNYQGLLKLEDFRPSLTKYVSEEQYINDDSEIKQEKIEDFYYLKSIWQIWYNNWVQKEIPMLVMEYKEE